MATMLGRSTPLLAQASTPSARRRHSVRCVLRTPSSSTTCSRRLLSNRGEIRSQDLLVDFSYGITDKLALSVSLPYTSGAKYKDSIPIRRDSILAVTTRPSRTCASVSVTTSRRDGCGRHTVRWHYHAKPQLSVTWAHSASVETCASAGQGLRCQAARCCAAWHVRDGTLRVRLHRAHPRHLAQPEQSQPRTRLLRQAGLQSLCAGSGTTHARRCRSPSPWSDASSATLLLQHHDQIGRDNELNLGGGAAYSVTPTMDLFGSVIPHRDRPQHACDGVRRDHRCELELHDAARFRPCEPPNGRSTA